MRPETHNMTPLLALSLAAMLLSTCNRTEIYTIISDERIDPAETVADFIIEKTALIKEKGFLISCARN